MLDANIGLSAVRKVMLVLQQFPSLDIPNLTVVMMGDSVRLCSQDELVEIVRTEKGMLNVLPLSGITEALDNELMVDVVHR
jgi:hypothetical protein